MKKQILVVEDEEKIARVLELELTFEGYEVTKAFNGLDGFRLFQEKEWDVILLDVMLPGLSGIELLRRIRSTNKEVVVFLLTAKDSVEDKVAGLDLGANDYVTKPFVIEELLARIRASLRVRHDHQPSPAEGDWMVFADLSLSESLHQVKRGETLIDLTPKEFALLAYLLKHPRQVLSRDQILQAVWGYDYFGDTNVVDVYIRYLRNKVDKSFSEPLIHTVRGVGYVLRNQS